MQGCGILRSAHHCVRHLFTGQRKRCVLNVGHSHHDIANKTVDFLDRVRLSNRKRRWKTGRNSVITIGNGNIFVDVMVMHDVCTITGNCHTDVIRIKNCGTKPHPLKKDLHLLRSNRDTHKSVAG